MAALVCLTWLGMTSQLAGLDQKPRVQYTTDYETAPATLVGLRDAVDAVVVGRVESSVARTFGQYERVATVHTVRVIEIVKGHAGIRGVGYTFEVEQSAGELELPDKIVTVNPRFAPLRPGDTHVFFLEWHQPQLHYAMAYGPQASFKINGLTIQTAERRGVGLQVDGVSVTAFLDALRR